MCCRCIARDAALVNERAGLEVGVRFGFWEACGQSGRATSAHCWGTPGGRCRRHVGPQALGWWGYPVSERCENVYVPDPVMQGDGGRGEGSESAKVF
jgi:hypothetical protein